MLLEDLISDVAAGICLSQKQAEALNGKFDLSKVKKYKPKTKVNDLILNTVNNNLDKSQYNWQHDMQFNSELGYIEIIEYNNNTSDWCKVKIDGVEKKISKAFLRELWESKAE